MSARPLIGILFLLFALPVFAGEHDAILGTWTTKNAKSRVDIYPCGIMVCGKIVSLKEPVYPPDDKKGMAGKTKIDRENPDPKLRTRPLVGLELLKDFKLTEPGLWKEGTIYDPESGNTYKCKMTLESPNRLKVRGYIGFSFIGRTQIWTR